jgi:hypothetical protein
MYKNHWKTRKILALLDLEDFIPQCYDTAGLIFEKKAYFLCKPI